MPLQKCRDSIRGVFGIGRVDFSGVTEQEVESCSRDGAFAPIWLELIGFALAAVGSDRLPKIREVEVGGVAAEAVALGFAGEQVMQVPPHRLAFIEPGLGYDVFAVERELGFERFEEGRFPARIARRFRVSETTEPFTTEPGHF